MSKTKTTIFGLSVSFLIVGPVLADPVDIPNQFQAGTPAVADEVNQNFSAVETAVDDNAADIAANETAIGELQSSIDTISVGTQVMVDGATVGSLVGFSPPVVEVDLPGGGTVLVEETARGLAGQLGVLSPMGYLFALSSSSISNALSQEGEIPRSLIIFDQIDCNGNRYFPVEGNTGVFSNFVLGSGFERPPAPWAARQGFVYASPSPTDPNQVYFVRKDAAVTTVTLHSFRWIFPNTLLPVCVNFSTLGWDLDPLLADHTVVPVEINDPTVTGVNGILGGDISLGF